MANIAEFNIDGASYTYDTESRNPLAKKNMKKVIDCEMVYDIDSKSPNRSVERLTIIDSERPTAQRSSDNE